MINGSAEPYLIYEGSAQPRAPQPSSSNFKWSASGCRCQRLVFARHTPHFTSVSGLLPAAVMVLGERCLQVPPGIRPQREVPADLPLRDVVVYPHMVIPLFVGRERSMKALESAMENGDKQILLLISQRAPEIDDPSPMSSDVGTQATVLQLLKLPDGTIKLLVEGLKRVEITQVSEQDTVFRAVPVEIESTADREPREIEVLSAI